MIDGSHREPTLFDLENGPIIPVEVNMEELPLFLFKTRDRTEEFIEAHDTVVTAQGERLRQYVKVTGGREFGLPGPADRDVYVAVMRHVRRDGGMPPDGQVSFTIYELLRLMGKNPKSGKNIENVRRSIDRIATTDVYAENAFYDRQGEVFESQRFRPWRVTFRRVRHRGKNAERHVLKFDEVLVRSYNANYVKGLDSDFYFSLRNDLAKMLYGLVDVRRKGKLRWTVEIHQLRALIPLPEHLYHQPSKIKERLQAAHRELLERGFLTRVDYEERRGKHLVHYGLSARFIRERAVAGDVATANLSPRDLSVVEGLIEVGMWSDVARGLVREHGPDHLLTYLDALPYQRGIANPAAWIRKYAENNWPVPSTGEQAGRQSSGKQGPFKQSSASPRISDSIAGPALEGGTRTREPENENEDGNPGEVRGGERRLIERQVRERLDAGEFDKTIEDLENLSYPEYTRFVAAPTPLVDALGNRYFVSVDGELYVYVGGRGPDQRFLVKNLDRPSPLPHIT